MPKKPTGLTNNQILILLLAAQGNLDAIRHATKNTPLDGCYGGSDMDRLKEVGLMTIGADTTEAGKRMVAKLISATG